MEVLCISSIISIEENFQSWITQFYCLCVYNGKIQFWEKLNGLRDRSALLGALEVSFLFFIDKNKFLIKKKKATMRYFSSREHQIQKEKKKLSVLQLWFIQFCNQKHDRDMLYCNILNSWLLYFAISCYSSLAISTKTLHQPLPAKSSFLLGKPLSFALGIPQNFQGEAQQHWQH